MIVFWAINGDENLGGQRFVSFYFNVELFISLFI